MKKNGICCRLTPVLFIAGGVIVLLAAGILLRTHPFGKTSVSKTAALSVPASEAIAQKKAGTGQSPEQADAESGEEKTEAENAPGDYSSPGMPEGETGDLAADAEDTNVAVDEALPHTYSLQRRRPAVRLEKAEHPLTGEDRLIAEKLIGGIRGYYENIEAIEFDFNFVNTRAPEVGMTGHVVCDRPDQFVFEGMTGDRNSATRIEWEKGAGLMVMKDDKLPRNLVPPDYSVLEEFFWGQTWRQDGYVDTFVSVLPDREIPDVQGNARLCTALCQPRATFYFENGTGRILKVENTDGRTLSFEYEGSAFYPKREEMSLPQFDAKIIFEYSRVKVKSKTGQSP